MVYFPLVICFLAFSSMPSGIMVHTISWKVEKVEKEPLILSTYMSIIEPNFTRIVQI